MIFAQFVTYLACESSIDFMQIFWVVNNLAIPFVSMILLSLAMVPVGLLFFYPCIHPIISHAFFNLNGNPLR
ncbi:hypothetical protein [Psychrobacillus sp. FJAT-21963]|uniref:hypothetical protein n=1 Tax=Psychrobacillus sp. FJAT-21963 TaxID=1712028 RepID=UPI0012E19A63|nr:hypothetical protein [Psychrobacillus sp. FJAT-21963]